MKQYVLLVILVFSVFFRVYHTQQIMGFWYDQGRDALVISKLIHQHKWFLVGPTTGIEGIFLGPFYYYFIAPFYWLGNGNPIVPAVWLVTTNVLTVLGLYWIGRSYLSHRAGLIASMLYGFSFKVAFDSRWLSNPTALPLFAVISIWFLLKIVHNRESLKDTALVGIAIGLSLQLEAASAVFFLPIAIIVILKSKKLMSIFLIFFFLTLLPQFLFNFRHQNLLVNGFKNFLITEKSFQTTLAPDVLARLGQEYQMFTHRVFPPGSSKHILFALTAIFAIVSIKKTKNRALIILLSWWALPIGALLFYHGNNGYIWDYYFIGQYPAFFLTLAWIWSRMPKPIMAIVVAIFLYQNINLHAQLFISSQPTYITLNNIISTVDWIYTDAANKPFNVDIYVPPVHADAYEYILQWRGEIVFYTKSSQDLQKRLYTIVEPDNEHPYYRKNWLTRQMSYGNVEKQVSVHPVLIQRISRYDFK